MALPPPSDDEKVLRSLQPASSTPRERCADSLAGPQPSGPLRLVKRAPMDDAELCRRVSARDAEALSALYDALVPPIRAAMRRILRLPAAELEDPVQTALEDVVRSLLDGSFTGACSLRTWASLIASRVAVDALRARIRERRLFAKDLASAHWVDEAPSAVAADRALEARAEIALVQQVLADMSPEYSVALVQHDVLGHGVAEVAKLNAISESAAQSRIFRGRQELLKRVAKRRRGGSP